LTATVGGPVIVSIIVDVVFTFQDPPLPLRCAEVGKLGVGL